MGQGGSCGGGCTGIFGYDVRFIGCCIACDTFGIFDHSPSCGGGVARL